MSAKVLMLGWEFPPHISGGLGTALHGLTRALDEAGTQVVFVIPRPPTPPEQIVEEHVVHPPAPPPPPDYSETITEQFEHVTFRTVTAQLDPYSPAETRLLHEVALRTRQYEIPVKASVPPPPPPQVIRKTYTKTFDIFHEVKRYAEQAMELAETETFDVVHAHDWMTYPAAMAAAAATGKPFVAHVHSTEFDRAGEQADPHICDIEYKGLAAADRVIAVSRMTKRIIVERYRIDPHKIDVVYNAVEASPEEVKIDRYSLSHNEKVVLFLGRLTHQKGPEFFLLAARKALEVMPGIKFVVAGAGDLADAAVQMAADLGIGHKVLFTGFLQGLDVERMFRMADLYVMPSVSEPFGIATLEALANDVPTIISKQSGVGEVVANSLKVDFWDTPEMANKIVAVLRHEPLATMLRQNGQDDVKKLSWDAAAKQCLRIYEDVTAS